MIGMDEVMERLYARLPKATTGDEIQAVAQVKAEIERLSDVLRRAAIARMVLCTDLVRVMEERDEAWASRDEAWKQRDTISAERDRLKAEVERTNREG